jgi:hypothetical protein
MQLEKKNIVIIAITIGHCLHAMHDTPRRRIMTRSFVEKITTTQYITREVTEDIYAYEQQQTKNPKRD